MTLVQAKAYLKDHAHLTTSRMTVLQAKTLQQAIQVVRYARRRRNPPASKTVKKRKAALKNPPEAVLIYSDVLRVEAKKGQNHRCDKGCVLTGHRYFHPFTAGAALYGLPNGDVLIRSTKGKRLWGMF